VFLLSGQTAGSPRRLIARRLPASAPFHPKVGAALTSPSYTSILKGVNRGESRRERVQIFCYKGAEPVVCTLSEGAQESTGCGPRSWTESTLGCFCICSSYRKIQSSLGAFAGLAWPQAELFLLSENIPLGTHSHTWLRHWFVPPCGAASGDSVKRRN